MQATWPILDFGLTYYSYRMAIDAKHQEQLLITRRAAFAA